MNRPGLIAILRGVRPEEVVAVGEAILAGGITTIEVPLNSPDPFASIDRLRRHLGTRAIVGAGTVLTATEVHRAHEVGAQIVVSPNCDPEVIQTSVRLGLVSYPGVGTVTEAFTALRAGAAGLKLFPASVLGAACLTAWREVLPPGTALVPVGGVDVDSIGIWARAGADGAGLGGACYRAGRDPDEVRARAFALVSAWRAGLAR